MICAVLAPRREEALSRIERAVERVGGTPMRLSGGNVCIAAWPSVITRVDSRRELAVDGTLEGELRSGDADGRFAAAQIERGRLVLARGFVGGRPMYWAREGDVFVAATRIGPLVAMLDRHPAMDRARLAELVLWDMGARKEATIYEGVHRLPSGEVMTIDARGGMTREALPMPSLSPIEGTPDELAEALRSEVFAAIERALEGKRRVAVACGGGVDSGALLAATVMLARGASAKEVVALAMDFAGPGDDRPHMRALADSLGLVPVRVPPSAFASWVEPTLIVDDQPYASATGAWDVGLAATARERGADALLMGLGGDELFDGDPRCLALRALRGDIVGAVRAAAGMRVPWDATRLDRVRDFVLRPIAVHATPRRLRRLVRRRRRSVAWAGPVMQRVLDRPIADPEDDFGPRTPEQFFRSLSDSTYALEISDARAQVAFETGCATLEPYRDPRLVAFVSRLPPAVLLHGGYMRGLFRHAFRGLMPDGVRLRTDKASFEPALEEMHGPIGGRAAFADLASMRALEELGIVRAKEYRRAFDAFLRKDDPGGDWIAVWPALSVEAFAQKHISRPS